MKAWLSEIIDQIALGEVLAKSKVSCGQRFGLIAVDNAVEFMLKAYVETYRQLVGGHKSGGIPKNQWLALKDHFEDLLNHVCILEPNLRPHEVEINQFHTYRNNLYHTSVPVTTTTDRVVKYSKLARDVLGILFSIPLTQAEWDTTLAQVDSTLKSEDASTGVKREVIFVQEGDLVKLNTSASLTQLEAVALCLHGYSKLVGKPPSRQELSQSLARSGHGMDDMVRNTRIATLQKDNWIQKNKLTLSAKGLKELRKKFLI